MVPSTPLKLIILGAFATLARAGGVQLETIDGRPHCTVVANEDDQNDVPHIREAFEKCGQSGTIVFPEDQEYYIAERLSPRVKDVQIEWRGQWTLSDDLEYWRNNSYHISFQNHAAGFVLTGDGIDIDGHSTGGINGNGDAWYSDEQGKTRPGRPMPFLFWNVSDVSVRNFFVKQPPLWAVSVMNGTQMHFENIYVNATSTDAPEGKNWVQNTDGFDTMDVNDVSLSGLVYQGGDDCIAIKPRSYNVYISNVTCNGGNGVAIGSLGQYEEDSSVENIFMTDFKLPRSRFGPYIKTWMGHEVPQNHYESEYKPRGGGWGRVRNITFQNFDVSQSKRVLGIDQNSGDNGTYHGTSKMSVSHITYRNFSGELDSPSNEAKLACSESHPCMDICFFDMDQVSTNGDYLTGSCEYVDLESIHGLDGC